MPESFSIKELGETIAKILGLIPGEDLELKRDRLDPNRVLVIRHPKADKVM